MEFKNSIRLVLVGSLISLVSVIAVVVYLMNAIANGANEEDYTRSYRAVEVAMETERAKMASLVLDNAVWNDAVREVYGHENRNWLGETWGASTAHNIYSIFMLLDEDDRTLLSYVNGKASDLTLDNLIGARKASFLRGVPRDGKTFGSAVDFFRTDEGMVMLGAGPVVPSDETVTPPGNKARIIVFASVINPETVSDIGKMIVVSDLHLAAISPTGRDWSYAPVQNNDGETVTYALWHDRRPGDVARKVVELPTLIVVIGLVGTTLWLIILAWRAADELRRREQHARVAARHDALTGLANRTAFRELLAESAARSEGGAALLFIDLDGFKFVNDTMGHRIGDALLQQVADRLREACCTPGTAIGRLGGDEFAVLFAAADPDTAISVARSVIDLLGAPYLLEHNNIRIGASIGIAIAPEHGNDAETLLARADMALYAAKSAGKGIFRIFHKDMEHRVHERVRLERELRAALGSREGLFVFYQPIVDIESGRVTAREALMRWHHPARGWISPGQFIPIAEQSGLIDKLGQFVLDRACRDAAEWTDGARVAVNVSAGQLGKGTVSQTVLSALLSSGLPADRLEVEVTETALLNHETDVVGDLRRLRDMGVRLALDDFGTGYSSLSHLRVFRFDKIKIDGSFVKDAVERPDCAAVVRAIADLGKRLGVTTVAEGVETEAHLERIRGEGCREVQGYLVGRPMPSERDAPKVGELNRTLEDRQLA